MKNRHDVIKNLFLRALDLESSLQEDFLRAECEDDSIVEEVLRMLDADANTVARNLENSPVHLDALDLTEDQIPHQIGKYIIKGVLGRGAMGVVYEATQDQPERRVAVKVLRNQHLGSSIMKRFELEAQLLARLRHPGIAHVYESGVATIDDGPAKAQYISMELSGG
jgi:serine/threonine protein kinase